MPPLAYVSCPQLSQSRPADMLLQFQNILALVLPDRSDRLGPLFATANATNLSLTIVDAKRDKDIPTDDIPQQWGTNGWHPEEGQLGCSYSHIMTWRKMIAENISSALVMESDVDWDLRIKPTMQGLADGARAIADFPFDPPTRPSKSRGHAKELVQPEPHIPYGDKWDMLWIGHCGANGNGDGRYYKYNDSSAPSDDHAWSTDDSVRRGWSSKCGASAAAPHTLYPIAVRID